MATMNFNTANNTFRQLLGNGIQYRVPPFQRDYSWTDDEWDDLWQDLLGLFESDGEPAHYMGYLVLQTSDSKQFDIIDGQQRITTFSVMILAALGHLKELALSGIDSDYNIKRKENIHNSYIGYVDPVSLIPHSKLELNRHNNRFYQTYMVTLEQMPQRNLNASEHLLRKAFMWFKDKIKNRCGNKGDDTAAFINSIVDKIFFTVITVNDELNAFKVFETLNARGVRLSATDLLKNYLFSLISSGSTHEAELKMLEDRWERIVGELGSESFPDFLRVYWNSCNKLVRKSDLFKTIRKKITGKAQAFDLLKGLDSASSVYAALRDPNDDLWTNDEKLLLEQILMFNVRQPLAMLLASYRAFNDSNRPSFTKILKAVSIISFRYNVICNMQAHDQERIYNDIAFRISDGSFSEVASIFKALRDIYPDDSVFKASFKEKELKTTNSRNRKVARYILFQIEKQTSGKVFDFESATYNIEHILPESPSEEWSEIEEKNQEKFVYRIGNMTPLETKKNRNIGNCGYNKKRSVYSESDFSITASIPEKYDEWNENKILSRQTNMADKAVAIWRLDFV